MTPTDFITTMKSASIYLVYFVLMCIWVQTVRGQDTQETRLRVTAPLNPIKNNDMVSIHCQVWNLDKDQQRVLIQRTIGDQVQPQLISLDENIQTNEEGIDQRFFLAHRRLNTGSVVYFLSIIDVTRSKDEGVYTCQLRSKSLEPLGIDGSVTVKVQFFPSEPWPQCTSSYNAGETVKSGTRLKFNCTSVDGFPKVDITWKKTPGSGDTLDATSEGHNNGIAYSHLDLVATTRYNEVMLICMISSSAFPDIVARTCHIGPLKVIPDPMNPEPDFNDNNELERTKPGGSIQHPISPPDYNYDEYKDGDGDIVNRESAECTEVCSSLSSPAFYWIIATIIASVLAFIFLIIGIIIAIKLCHMPTSNQNNNIMDQSIYRQPLDDVYERLECSRDDNRMYMALHGLRKPDNLVVQTNVPVEIEGNYTRTPTATLLLPGAPGGQYGLPISGPTTDTHPPVILRPMTPDKLS